MKNILILLIALLPSISFAQSIDSLDIETCKKITIENYPITKDLELNIEASQKKVDNIKTIYLPTLDLTGQFTTQSDVPHMTVDNPMFNLPVVSKEQYKVQLEIKQLIYDGGLSKMLKRVEEANLQVNNQSIHVSLYKLNSQLNDVYFLILLFQEQQKLLNLTKTNIQNQLKVVQSGVKNGVLLPGEADIISVEILKLKQKITELNSGRLSGIEVLSELMDTSLNETVFLSIPKFDNNNTELEIVRPEHELMNLQASKIDAANKLNSAKKYPYIGLFGNFGYGYPGMNMLEDEPAFIYVAGIHFKWNIWDWKKTKREKQINTILKEKISTQKEVFDKNLKIALNKEDANIKKLSKMIESDTKIIELRERITRTKSAQLKNGVITSSDYIRELNSETQAKISKQLHELQKIKATVKYNTLKGKN